VAASGETTDAPTVPGEIGTPVPKLSDAAVVKQPSVLPEAILTPAPNVIIPGSAEEKKAMNVKYDLKQKMLREIAASQLLREELAKANPNLLNVSSFMSQVCGMDRGTRLLKETAGFVIQRGRVEELAAEASITGGAAGDEEGIILTFGLAEEIIGDSIGVPKLAESIPQTAWVAAESRETDASESAKLAMAGYTRAAAS